VTTPREQALALHEQYGAHFDRIRGNTALSDEGKRQQLAPAYVDYRNKLNQIAENATATTARRKTDLIRSAFGIPTDPIAAMSYRDALGRADEIDDPSVATYKLHDALETGDVLMAKAIAKKAADTGWADTLDVYTAATPQAGAALTALSQLQAYENSPQRMFMDAAHFQPQPPPELAGMQDWQIDSLANPDGPDAHEASVADFAAALQGVLATQQPSQSGT
jgi:hypothetical protein